MFSHLYAVSLAWVQAHPTMAVIGALTVLNVVCAVVKKKSAPGSKAYQAASFVLSLVTDGMGAWNALRGMAGKAPVALPDQPPADDAHVSPGASLFSDPSKTAPLKALLVIAAATALLLPTQAKAYDFHVGPSASLFEVKPGDLHPVQLAPGLGVQAGLYYGKWSFDGALFGQLSSLSNSMVGSLSLAPFACYTPFGACLGPKVDLATSDGHGLLSGKWLWRENFGVVFSLNEDAFSQLSLKL